MNGNGGHSSGGAIAALFFAIGALLLFAFGFAFFLVLPFFIFLGGIVAMLVSDRRRDSGPAKEEAVVVQKETVVVRENGAVVQDDNVVVREEVEHVKVVK